MKWEHPANMAQKLQGTLFICFTYNCSFLSSKALIAHQCSHCPTTRPSLLAVITTAQPTFPCSDWQTLWAGHFSEVAPGARGLHPSCPLCLHQVWSGPCPGSWAASTLYLACPRGAQSAASALPRVLRVLWLVGPSSDMGWALGGICFPPRQRAIEK